MAGKLCKATSTVGLCYSYLMHLYFTPASFDMVHFGHFNALRQAKKLGDYLIVGVHSDGMLLHTY